MIWKMLDMMPGGATKGYKGEPFTGYEIVDYFPGTKNIQFEYEYKNGEECGWVNEYFPTGELKKETLSFGCFMDLMSTEYDIAGNIISTDYYVSKANYEDTVNRYDLLS